MKTLAQLQEEEKQLKDLLSENKKQQSEIKIAQFIEKTGLKVGTKILFNGREGEISSVQHDWRVYPFARFKNKNGTLGIREERIWEHEEITIIP